MEPAGLPHSVPLAGLTPGCFLSFWSSSGSPHGQAGLNGVAEGGKDGPSSAYCPPQVAYFQSALDKLNEAIKLAKVKLRKSLAAPQSPERIWSVPGGPRVVLALSPLPSLSHRASLTRCRTHCALLWMSLEESESLGLGVAFVPSCWEGSWSSACITGRKAPVAESSGLTAGLPASDPRYNSAKKDNDFIYHEAVPALDTLQPVKGLELRGGRGWEESVKMGV